jgi:hypothetical protein
MSMATDKEELEAAMRIQAEGNDAAPQRKLGQLANEFGSALVRRQADSRSGATRRFIETEHGPLSIRALFSWSHNGSMAVSACLTSGNRFTTGSENRRPCSRTFRKTGLDPSHFRNNQVNSLVARPG